MSDILEKLRKDMFLAVKEHNEQISGIIQLTMASIKNAEIVKGEPLDDEEVIDIIRKETKKLQDSIDQFEAAGRDDLAETSIVQKEYLDTYLPKMMDRSEVEVEVRAVIKDMGADSPKDMGKVMGATMGKLKGKADGVMVKEVVTEQLSK